MSETDLSLSIRRALDACGIWNFRVPSGCIRKGRYTIMLAPEGTYDTWTEYGWLESKDPSRRNTGKRGGKRDAAQREWKKKADEHGIRNAIVCSVSEALAVVSKWRAEEEEKRKNAKSNP